ncbi:RNA polymerase sigma factor [Robiginitalea sp. IMCC43444]|uniref:RNA polymerase sigma factor n=1 Tax=Robiginitalea sp. IMCC43444 TaxID=3459121 RepID=UPI00404160DA
MKPVTDEIIMQQLVNEGIKHLEPLYNRYQGRLMGYFTGVTGDYHASNDLLMQTFERLYSYRRSFKEGSAFRPWLYQIANNCLRDYFRKKKKSAFESKEGEGTVEFKYPGAREERETLLRRAMDRLPIAQKRVIHMYYLLEMTYAEISKEENISVNNARILVCRGLRKLNKLLKTSGI